MKKVKMLLLPEFVLYTYIIPIGLKNLGRKNWGGTLLQQALSI